MSRTLDPWIYMFVIRISWQQAPVTSAAMMTAVPAAARTMQFSRTGRVAPALENVTNVVGATPPANSTPLNSRSFELHSTNAVTPEAAPTMTILLSVTFAALMVNVSIAPVEAVNTG